MNRNVLMITGLALTLIAAGNAFAGGNAAEGEKKSAVCAACHGAGGNAPTTPDYPRLAGQHQAGEYQERPLTSDGPRHGSGSIPCCARKHWHSRFPPLNGLRIPEANLGSMGSFIPFPILATTSAIRNRLSPAQS